MTNCSSESEGELFLLAVVTASLEFALILKPNDRAENIRIKESAILYDLLSVDVCTSALTGQKRALHRKDGTCPKLCNEPEGEKSENKMHAANFNVTAK